MSANGGLAIGVDIGGTFTDVVVRVPDAPARILKIPTTRADPSRAVLAALARMEAEWGLAPAEVARFVHGTTVATNAVLERKGACVGLITTRGFRDVLEMRRRDRRRTWGLWGDFVPIADRDGQCVGAINLSTHSTRTTRNELREIFLPELKAVFALGDRVIVMGKTGAIRVDDSGAAELAPSALSALVRAW